MTLPPLPETLYTLAFWDEVGMHNVNGQAYTEEQMRAYAEAAVLAEREACAGTC